MMAMLAVLPWRSLAAHCRQATGHARV